MKKEYKTQTYNAIKGFVYLFSILTILSLLIIIIGKTLSSHKISVQTFACTTSTFFFFTINNEGSVKIKTVAIKAL
jgi:Ni,Fe-hydrogenase I cytochrome b subunit